MQMKTPRSVGVHRLPPHGFTLVELMVTLVLAGILILLAIPGFTSQWRGWQRDSATRTFTAHVQLARSAAIKTSRRVVMCSSSNGSACANSHDWSAGWIVFVDSNADNVANSSETVLASRGPLAGLTSMLASGSVRRLSFMPNGLLGSNATSVSVIPLGGTSVLTNEITINRVGRAYVKSKKQEA